MCGWVIFSHPRRLSLQPQGRVGGGGVWVCGWVIFSHPRRLSLQPRGRVGGGGGGVWVGDILTPWGGGGGLGDDILTHRPPM